MNSPQKILVYVYEDLLGDCILKLPFVHALRKYFPDAHIVWCAGGGKSLYASSLGSLVQGKLNSVIEVSLGKTWLELFFSSPLKDQFFDLILDTQRDLKTTLSLKKIPHKAFVSRTSNFFFSDFKPEGKKTFGSHLSDQLIFLLEVMAGKKVDAKYPADYRYLDSFRREIEKIFSKNKKYVGFAPGAGNIKKCWPLNRFIEVAHFVVDQGKVPVFILGPAEQKLYSSLKKEIPSALFPLQENLKFLSNPLYTSAIGFFLEAVVVNDSGTAHLLSLSDTYLISLFGPTKMEKTHPLAKKISFIKASDFGGTDMNNILSETVIKALKDI